MPKAFFSGSSGLGFFLPDGIYQIDCGYSGYSA